MTKRQPFVCLDVLSALIDKPRTVEQLATELEAHPQTVRYGLKALETLGLVRLSGVVKHDGKGVAPFLWASEVGPRERS